MGRGRERREGLERERAMDECFTSAFPRPCITNNNSKLLT